MKCDACRKEHPPERVTRSEGNPSQQPRPYHCPSCWQATRGDKKHRYWNIGTVAEAESCSNHGRHRPAPGGLLPTSGITRRRPLPNRFYFLSRSST